MSPVLRIAVIGNAQLDPTVATTPSEVLPPYSIADVRDSYDRERPEPDQNQN